MLLVHELNAAFVHSRLVLIGFRLVCNVVSSCTECSICSFSSCFDWLPVSLVAGLSIMLLVHVLNVAFVHSCLVLIGFRLVCNVVSSCTECSICSFSSCFDWLPACL